MDICSLQMFGEEFANLVEDFYSGMLQHQGPSISYHRKIRGGTYPIAVNHRSRLHPSSQFVVIAALIMLAEPYPAWSFWGTGSQ